MTDSPRVTQLAAAGSALTRVGGSSLRRPASPGGTQIEGLLPESPPSGRCTRDAAGGPVAGVSDCSGLLSHAGCSGGWPSHGLTRWGRILQTRGRTETGQMGGTAL